MALVLVIEDGTGLSDANSYASAETADAYHEAHLYATTWTGATDDNKAKALAMATRVLDSNFRWNGFRKGSAQRLEWPRVRVERQGSNDRVQFPDVGVYWPENELPRPLVEATCELARLLLDTDRTADADSKGISRLGLGNGAIDITFDKEDRPTPITDEIRRMLVPIGKLRGKSMAVKVVR